MAIDLIFSPANPTNPLEIARRTLVAKLARMPIPNKLGTYPIASDFEAIRDHLRQAADIFDEWLGAIGMEVKDNAPCRIDMRQFEGAFTGAVDGMATYELDTVAETLRDEAREVA